MIPLMMMMMEGKFQNFEEIPLIRLVNSKSLRG